MTPFKLLESPNAAQYMQNGLSSHNGRKWSIDMVDGHFTHFDALVKKQFLDEIKKYHTTRKAAGHSSAKGYDYLSIILVCSNGTPFHHITSTRLIRKDNVISDYWLHKRKNVNDKVLTVYHVLPEGKLFEYRLIDSYLEELNGIYSAIANARLNHDLSKHLSHPEGNEVVRKTKL